MDTQTTTTEEKRSPSLLKQLSGAGVGMLVALGVYAGYNAVSPSLQASLEPTLAYLFPPGTNEANPPSSGTRFADPKDSKQIQDRVAARAKEIVNHLISSSSSSEESIASVSSEAASTPAEMTQEPTAKGLFKPHGEGTAPTAMTIDPWEDPTHGSEISSMQNASSEGSVEGAAAQTKHANAKKLPSSGIGLWAAVFAALGASAMSVPRVRKWVMERA